MISLQQKILRMSFCLRIFIDMGADSAQLHTARDTLLNDTKYYNEWCYDFDEWLDNGESHYFAFTDSIAHKIETLHIRFNLLEVKVIIEFLTC